MTKIKIGIVSSCGGHLTEVRALLPAYGQYEHFYVLDDHVLLSPDMQSKTYFVAHSERDWKFLLNQWEAFRICLRERPDDWFVPAYVGGVLQVIVVVLMSRLAFSGLVRRRVGGLQGSKVTPSIGSSVAGMSP